MKKELQESDFALFRDAVKDVEQLRHDAAEPFRRRIAPKPRPRDPLEEDDDNIDARGISEAEVETHDYLEFMRPGVQRRLFAELQRGEVRVDLEVDLHGLRVSHAYDVLREFLTVCRERRTRCALIIHGKGFGSSERQPVLKRKVNYWLRLRKEVLAFCSATRRDGGSGAVYVLLRNPDKGKNAQRRQR